MNHAYIDASWQEQPTGLGLGGWGLVLLLPGQMAARYSGQLDAPDNNAAEMRAVQAALQVAPAGQKLTVFTDNQAVLSALMRGRGSWLLGDLTEQIHAEAQARQTHLTLRYAPRTGRHMQVAHDLANEARRSQTGFEVMSASSRTEVQVTHRPGQPFAQIALRRAATGGRAERIVSHLEFDMTSDIPPSVQALFAALELARPSETLTLRHISRLAQALWNQPERALREPLQQQLRAARQQAEALGIALEFVG